MRGNSKWLVVFLVIAVSATLGGSLWYLNQSKQECFGNGQICLSFDETWKKENLKSSNLDKYILVRLRHSNPKGEFQITSQDGHTNIKDAKFTDSIVSKLGTELSDFKLIKSGTTRIADSDAAAFIYEYKYRNNNNKSVSNRQKLLIWSNSGRVYYITVQATPGDFESIARASEDVINSIKQARK